jgi:Fe-S cluster assembly protein SufD
MTAFAENLVDAFESQKHLLSGDESGAVANMRSESLKAATRLGLPSFRDEHWKYTNVSALVSGMGDRAFRIPENDQNTGGTARGIEAINEQTPAFASTRLVFIDGNLAEHLSQTDSIASGVSVKRISELLADNDSVVASSLNSESLKSSVFAQINTSFIQDGAIIEVDSGAAAGSIEVVFAESGAYQLTCPRLIVKAGANSTLTIIETHLSLSVPENGSENGLTSAVTEIHADRGSNVEHFRLQFDRRAHHIGNVKLNAAADATISTHSIALGGKLTRIDIDGSLNERGSHIDMFGLFVANDNQHIDHHTRIDHLAPNTTSNENFKGIADDEGRGVFNGKIFVKQDAQKISAIQSSRNLLLSDNAEIDTKPELEIYADDVKCAHGATVGQLSEDEMFYLRARGIDYSTARTILTVAFAGDIVDGISNETLRKNVESRVSALITATK